MTLDKNGLIHYKLAQIDFVVGTLKQVEVYKCDSAIKEYLLKKNSDCGKHNLIYLIKSSGCLEPWIGVIRRKLKCFKYSVFLRYFLLPENGCKNSTFN